MEKETIQFKRERDFGDLFNATFSFIGQEFKLLGTAILYFVVPFLLLSAIAGTFYSIHFQQLAETMNHTNDPFAFFKVMSSMFGYVGVYALLSLISTTIMFGTIYSYIKLYVEKGSGNFSLNDVWMLVTKNFLRLFFGVIIAGLVIMIGFAFCIIPGIYFWIALSILFCIMMFEEKDFGTSFGRSLKLINKKWWFTFGLLLVMAIMLYILRILVSIPAMVVGLKSVFANFGNYQSGEFVVQHFSLGFYIIGALTKLVTHLLGVIPIVLTAFLYFSVVEKIEKPSLMEKIDQIGTDE